MKRALLIVLLLALSAPLSLAATLTPFGSAGWASASGTQEHGWGVLVGPYKNISGVMQFSSQTDSGCYVRSSLGGTIIANGTYSGQTCTFNQSIETGASSAYYWFTSNKGGASRTWYYNSSSYSSTTIDGITVNNSCQGATCNTADPPPSGFIRTIVSLVYQNVSGSQSLTIQVNDTRNNQILSGFNFNVSNGSVSWAGYCASINCTNSTINVTNAALSVWNVSGGRYFNATSALFNFSNATGLTVTAHTFSNSLTMNLSNVVNASNITAFCGMTNTSVSGCTTNGSLTLFGVIGDLTLTWYDVSSGTYFNATKTLTAYNSSASNQSATTFQAWLNVTATRAFTGATITDFNSTNWLVTNTTPGGASDFLQANNGTNNVQVVVGGNYTVNVTCTVATPLTTNSCIASGIYDNRFNITARNESGSVIANFTVNASSTIGSASLTSVNNATVFNLTQGTNWTFTIDAPGYAITNVTLPANASTNSYQFNMSPTNSVYIYVYDQSTLALLNTVNVTVTMQSGLLYLNETKSTGTFVFQNLTAGNWTVSVSSNGYSSSSYFLQVTDRSTQTLNAYLAQTSTNVIFTNKDALTGDVISNATFTVQNKVGPNWVTVGQTTTDAFGQAVFQLLPLHEYQFIVSADGYFTKTGVVNTVITSYTVLVNPNNTQAFTSYANDFSYKVLPSAVSANLTSFSIITSSPQGALQWFAVVVSYNGTNTTQNITGSPSGGTANVTIDFTNVTGSHTVTATYYAKSVNINAPLAIARTWYVYGGYASSNYTFVDFVEYYGSPSSPFDMTTRGIIVTLVAVALAAGAGLFLGGAAAMMVAATVFLIAGAFGWLSIGLTVVVVGGLVGLLLLGGRA